MAKRSDYRDAVRSWLVHYKGIAVHRFFIGSVDGADYASLVRENQEHGDLIVLNSAETRERLIFKTISIFEWGETSGAEYVAKMDDDCHVSVFLQEATLSLNPHSSRLLLFRCASTLFCTG
jgi:hypothetical protein